MPGGGPRLIFVCRSIAACQEELDQFLKNGGLAKQLGRDAFPRSLRHQSLSARYIDTPEIRERLFDVGAQIASHAFKLRLDMLTTSQGQNGLHVEARMRGDSTELTALVRLLNDLIEAQGLPAGGGHAAHVTLSYGFSGKMPRTQTMPTIDWLIHEAELVVGGGNPYDYVTLGRWLLGPPLRQAEQPSLL